VREDKVLENMHAIRKPDEAETPPTDEAGSSLAVPGEREDGNADFENEVLDLGEITVRTVLEDVPRRLEVDAYREEIVIEHEAVGQLGQ
jgi:hypothetical protein